ncbi:MAG: alpha/beta hydrolase [Paracoccaceae bacterium]
MTMVKIAFGTILAAYLLICGAMYIVQRQLQYFPAHRAPAPETLGLSGVRVERLETTDGAFVDLWYAPAAPGKPTILFFHGNAGEIADRAPRFAAYRQAGFGAAFLSYRGYGNSTGSPSEEGFFQDARAAYYWLLRENVPSANLVVLGESLGTGVAVQLAASVPLGAVVLEAPYAAAVDIAADLYPWLPVRLLMKDQFRSIDHITSVTTPLLILHGTADRVIPYAQGQRLFAAANEPKTLVPLQGAGHDALFDPHTWAQEIAHLNRLFPG